MSTIRTRTSRALARARSAVTPTIAILTALALGASGAAATIEPSGSVSAKEPTTSPRDISVRELSAAVTAPPTDRAPAATGTSTETAGDDSSADDRRKDDLVAASHAEAPAPVSPEKVHLRSAALALAAAVPSEKVRLTEASVVAAARALDMDVSIPLSQDDATRVKRRAWRNAGGQMTLAGIPFGSDGPDRRDFVRAAGRLGLSVEKPLRPVDIHRVLRAGRNHIRGHFRRSGIDVGRQVGMKDLRRAARRFGVDYGEKIYPKNTVRIAHVVERTVKARREAKRRTPIFARTGGVALALPSHNVRYAGFHQASARNIQSLRPSGKARTRRLPSRRRGTGRTTAIDIVMRPGEDVRSPVTGRVVEVRAYRLYGKYPDYRVRIVPSGNRGLLVTALHVKNPRVRVGQNVKAGRTVIAGSVRKFPFFSQVDGYSGKPWGHVHIEARRR